MPWGPLAGFGYVPPNPLREAPHGIYGDAPSGRRESGRRLVEIPASRLANAIRGLPWADASGSGAEHGSALVDN